MRLTGTFKALDFRPTAITPIPPITTALPMGVSTMRKTFAGEITSQSATLFSAAFDPAAGKGTYVAMEAFEGSLGPRHGTFAFLHSATTSGSDRSHEVFFIVPNSGTADLSGLTGTGGIAVDSDDTHRIWFDLT